MSDELEQEPKRQRRRMSAKIANLDRKLIFHLAAMQCSLQEIADALEIGQDSLVKWYGDLIDKGRSEGRKSLRRAQFEKAVTEKDPRMLIFLGKQYLGQKDQPDSGENTAPLPWLEDK
jgi:hypothetical protein